jgi:hypothetical protein
LCYLYLRTYVIINYIAHLVIIAHLSMGPSWLRSYGSWIYNYLCNQCLSPLLLWVRISTRAWCTALCDNIWQWLATGRWFSPGPPVSSTNNTDRHDIAEILLKVALHTNYRELFNIFFRVVLLNYILYILQIRAKYLSIAVLMESFPMNT